MDMVQYSVKAEYATQNKENIRRVVNELRGLRRTDISYSVFVKDDGKTFVHSLQFAHEEAKKVFTSLESFREFQLALQGSNPEVPPLVTHLTVVGSTLDLL